MASDLRFECPSCGQHLAVEEKGAGMTVNCPGCNQPVKIPSRSAAPPPVPVVPAVKQTPSPVTGRLIKCRDCGHAISSKATSCPACGAPVKRTNPAVPVLIGIIILFAAFVGVIGYLVQDNSSSPSSSAKNPVKTHVGLTASAVAITNLDEYAWLGVKVYVNGNPLDGYKAVYDRQVAPHERILIPLTDFARRDRRFNPVERKVTQVIVWVEGHGAPIFSFR
jgi:predicted RNA-binding Zn-ribbon protein involved in translation (DUF1610 family)